MPAGRWAQQLLHQSERRAFAAGACGQAEAALASADTGRGRILRRVACAFCRKKASKTTKKTLALGGFCALHANPQAAVYLGEDLREAYRQEAKRFYDPGLLENF